MSKPRLLWVGDAVVATGFERATRYTTRGLMNYWDVSILGLNHIGDPHDYLCKVFACRPDPYGVARLPNLVKELKIDLVVIQNDVWNIPDYLEKIPGVPVIGAIAVDARNVQGHMLNGLDGAVFWTKFGLAEAQDGGFTKPGAVIPLGVDRSIYQPMPKEHAFKILGFDGHGLEDKFIIGNVNRNQPRKRLDLLIKYFCRWISEYKVEDAYLFMHVAPTGDVGWDIPQLFKYYMNRYGVADKKRLIIVSPEIGYGVPERVMNATYNAMTIQATTTYGEGMGLPILEGYACGKTAVFPYYSALGEWASPAGMGVLCDTEQVMWMNINTVGGLANEDKYIKALDRLYREKDLRASLEEKALALAARKEYDWFNIGEAFNQFAVQTLAQKQVDAVQNADDRGQGDASPCTADR